MFPGIVWEMRKGSGGADGCKAGWREEEGGGARAIRRVKEDLGG